MTVYSSDMARTESYDEARMTIFAELAAMAPGARKKLVNELVGGLHDYYCKGCGGDLQNGVCKCGSTVNVTFHTDGSVTAKKPKRAR